MTFRLPIAAAAVAVLVAAAPVNGALAAGQDYSVEQIKQDTSELLTSLKDYSVEQKDEAVNAVEESLDAIDDRIVELEARIDENWEDMSEAARTSARETMHALREQRTDVAEWLGSLRASTKDAWADMKDGFSNAYNDMSDAWNEAERELGGKS